MTRTQPTPKSPKTTVRTAQQTLIDHLHELRSRLFWIVLALIIAGSASYLIQNQIMTVLMRPLGGQRLVYLTPIGGFNFIFKVSLYFGIGVILPVIMYHLYRFLEPLMDKRRKRSVVLYIVASFLLAIGGACFAYFGSLPAAMHFLTSFNIQNVSAMLTVDSYLNFVITYILGFAALFQIPLILLIFNSIKPLPPKKLLSFQRFVILAAFILAAIISPTPDITNQAILAVPIILMYQIGVLLVWLQGRTKRGKAQVTAQETQPALGPVRRTFTAQPLGAAPQPHAVTTAAAAPIMRPIARPRPVMDIAPRRAVPTRAARPIQADIVRRVPTTRQLDRTHPRPLNARRGGSIDGIVSRAQPQAG